MCYSTHRDSVPRRLPTWPFTIRADRLCREKGDDFRAAACGRHISVCALPEQRAQDQSEYGSQGRHTLDYGWAATDKAWNWHCCFDASRGNDQRTKIIAARRDRTA